MHEKTNLEIKEPLPGKETVSVSIITGRKYTAREQQQISSLKSRLKKQARLPGYLFTGDWRIAIGPAYPLLGVIICTCDWNTGVWRGQLWLLAEVIGRSERTISNWIRQLKKIHGLEVRYFSTSIAIELPESLIPGKTSQKKGSNFLQKPRKNEAHGQQYFSEGKKNWRLQYKQQVGDSALGKPRKTDGMQHFADLI